MTAKICYATQTTETKILLRGHGAVEMRIPEKPITLKDWFIKKEFGHPIYGDILGILKESEKAM